ncbi:hypothetical protein HCN52_23055 [Streptomyces bohaiensis]|uniref:Uncharacterized protein n=2 Tax=Streptomyces bohaiensis TaxID=1431344 RepID=A0ABX1CKT9_9ACTN|nr:hypothetical protein [Streptomyces bohaiensis]
MIVRMLHERGLRSEQVYCAATASVGLSVASWFLSRRAERGASRARADRWGIFVGEWAPTLFGLGIALSQYERDELHLAEAFAEDEPEGTAGLA